MNYACYASEQSAIENFWHNEKRLNSYRFFGCTAPWGLFNFRLGFKVLPSNLQIYFSL